MQQTRCVAAFPVLMMMRSHRGGRGSLALHSSYREDTCVLALPAFFDVFQLSHITMSCKLCHI